MKKLRLQIFHQAMAPYRIDLFNALNELFELEVVFLRSQVSYHRELSQSRLRSALQCAHSDLTQNWVIAKRDVPVGIAGSIRRFDPDVVVTGEFSLSSIISSTGRWAGRKRYKHVIWSEGNPVAFRNYGLVQTSARRMLGRSADALLFYTAESCGEFARTFGVLREKIFRCANHQSEVRIRARSEISKASVLRELGERNLCEARLILYVGRLVDIKNVAAAVVDFSTVFGGDENVHFVIVGSGAAEPEIMACAAKLGLLRRVHLMGHREGDDVYGWYRVSSVFILPSKVEPYGAVVNEALVTGLPVLCSAAAGARALITSTNGYLFDPNRKGQMALALDYGKRWLRPASERARDCSPDLMPYHFKDDLHGFVDAVNYAMAGRQ